MSGRTYSIIAGVILVLSVALIVGGIYFALQARQAQIASLPTEAVLPTLTPTPTRTATNTPRPTLPPTFTPTFTVTPTPSDTPVTPSATFTPSNTPTITDTATFTATSVFSPTPTPTSTFTPSATSDLPTPTPSDTRSPYPFQLRGGEVIYTSNTYNSAGCAFQGIGGQVLDTAGNGINTGITVVAVDDNGRTYVAQAGDNSRYGANGGFEIGVDTRPNRRTYLVELRVTATGVAISPLIEVTFPSDCDRNVALLYFRQTRPY